MWSHSFIFTRPPNFIPFEYLLHLFIYDRSRLDNLDFDRLCCSEAYLAELLLKKWMWKRGHLKRQQAKQIVTHVWEIKLFYTLLLRYSLWFLTMNSEFLSLTIQDICLQKSHEWPHHSIKNERNVNENAPRMSLQRVQQAVGVSYGSVYHIRRN